MQTLLMMLMIFAVFYFLVIRPQQKKMKEHKGMLGSIRRGDKVVTGGGIVGTVVRVQDDDDVMIEIAEGIKVRVQRSLIANVRSKTEPVREDSKPANDSAPDGAGKGAGAALKALLGGKEKDK